MRPNACALIIAIIACATLTARSDQSADLAVLRSSLATLEGDLNKVGEAIKGGKAMTPTGVALIKISKEIIALGRSSTFTNDLNKALVTAPKPLAADFSSFDAGIPAVAGAAALPLTELNNYKLDKPIIDLDRIINVALADTKKTPLSSLQRHLVALGTDLDVAGHFAIDPSLAVNASLEDATPVQDVISTNISKLPFVLLISTGATFQSPYSVSYDSTAGTARLTNTGNSTVPYLQVSYFDRFVMRPQGRIPNTIDQDSWHWIWDWPQEQKLWYVISRPDIEWHLGFLLNNSTSTNIPASSIAGGGDFWTDASVGFPILRYKSASRNQQITVNFTGGATTDKQFLAVHPFFTPGLGYQLAFQAPSVLGTTPTNVAFLISKVGYGLFDVPSLVNQSLNLNVNVTSLPQFDSKWAPTIGSYLAYPLGGGTFLELNVNAYFMRNPTPWNISAGVTLPLDTIGKIFH